MNQITKIKIYAEKQWGIILLIIIAILAIEYKFGIIKKLVNAKPKESNYSPTEYANYPNLTGNPVADIAILNKYESEKGSEKVICKNCGWSWSKKDSEPHDVYTCHKCGKTN